MKTSTSRLSPPAVALYDPGATLSNALCDRPRPVCLVGLIRVTR